MCLYHSFALGEPIVLLFTHCFSVFLRKTFSHLKYTPTYMFIVVAVGLIRLSYHKNHCAEQYHRCFLNVVSDGWPKISASYTAVLQDHASGSNRREREREHNPKVRPTSHWH